VHTSTTMVVAPSTVTTASAPTLDPAVVANAARSTPEDSASKRVRAKKKRSGATWRKVIMEKVNAHVTAMRKDLRTLEGPNCLYPANRQTIEANVMDKYVARWTAKDGVRELVTNTIDGCKSLSRDVIGADVVWTVHTDKTKYHGVIDPTHSEVYATMKWQAVASVGEVEVGSIRFSRGRTSGRLYATFTNHHTCLCVPRIMTFGYTTKRGDVTQCGQFGDGLKSAAVALVRQRMRKASDAAAASFLFVSNGRVWRFGFFSDGRLHLKKETTMGSGKKLSLTSEQTRTTVAVLMWPNETRLSQVFDPSAFLTFNAPAKENIVLLSRGARLFFGDEYRNSVYITGIRVGTRASLVPGAGFEDDAAMKKTQERDRGRVDDFAVSLSFSARLVQTLMESEKLPEGDPQRFAAADFSRIYRLVAKSRDIDQACAFDRLARIPGGLWTRAFEREFQRIHGDDAFPYNERGEKRAISTDLGMRPILVNRYLIDILRRSSAFSTVEDAIRRKFIELGEDDHWDPAASRTYAAVRSLGTTFVAYVSTLDDDVDYLLDGVHCYATKCRRSVVVTGIYSLSVHLNLKKVKVIDAAAVVDGSDADADLETAGSGADAHTATRSRAGGVLSKVDAEFRLGQLLRDTLDALMDVECVPKISRPMMHALQAQLYDLARGKFDGNYCMILREEEQDIDDPTPQSDSSSSEESSSTDSSDESSSDMSAATSPEAQAEAHEEAPSAGAAPEAPQSPSAEDVLAAPSTADATSGAGAGAGTGAEAGAAAAAAAAAAATTTTEISQPDPQSNTHKRSLEEQPPGPSADAPEDVRPHKRPRVDCPKAESIDAGLPETTAEDRAGKSYTVQHDSTHGYNGPLNIVGQSVSCGATFLSAGEALPDAEFLVFEEIAAIVRPILNGVFGWSLAVTFGVYREETDTIAFAMPTDTGGQLFINAHHHPRGDATVSTISHYFSVICHELCHIGGCIEHDENFACAYADTVAHFQPRLLSYFTSKYVSSACTVDCAVARTLVCGQHINMV